MTCLSLSSRIPPLVGQSALGFYPVLGPGQWPRASESRTRPEEPSVGKKGVWLHRPIITADGRSWRLEQELEQGAGAGGGSPRKPRGSLREDDSCTAAPAQPTQPNSPATVSAALAILGQI